MDKTISYGSFFSMLRPQLGERAFRLTSSALAKTLPRGGISLVANASGLSRPTIYSGIHELEHEEPAPSEPERQRKAGGIQVPRESTDQQRGVPYHLRGPRAPYSRRLILHSHHPK